MRFPRLSPFLSPHRNALCTAMTMCLAVSARASLSDYDATITADAASGPVPTAKLTNAVTFNGTNSTPFNFGTVTGDATFECIVEGTPSTADGYLAVGANTTSNLRFEQWNNTGQMGMTQLAVADYLFTPGVPTPVTAAHITYVWNGAGVMKLYVNGALSGTNSAVTAAFGLPSGAGRLGANPGNGEGMVGTIYRVTCYDSVLTEEAILRHADSYRGILRPPAVRSFTANPATAAPGASVTLTWDVTGSTSLTLNAAIVTGQTQAVFTQQTTTTYTLVATNGNGQTTAVRTVPVIQAASHAVINEFMAENKSVLADEDGDFSDWLELFNPTAASADLNGWSLTDDPALPAKWPLPAAILGPGQFRIVFLSGKDRTAPAGPWHTNFRLDKDGEYLALNGPGALRHEFTPAFPPQDEDVSFGLTGGDTSLAGFMAHPTPGAANDASPPLPSRVAFSVPSGLISGPNTVELTCATPGAEIRYRINDAAAEQIYTAPLTVSATTQIRAWAVRYGQQSAPVFASYVRLAPALAAYAGPLPILVIENFAAGPIPQKGWSSTGAGVQQVHQQPGAWLAWDRAGATASPAQGPPQFFSRAGLRGRGAFSSTWRQKPYAIEAENEAGGEKDVSVLGMPANADWVLYFPDPDSNKDPTLLFNTFIYELSQRFGRQAARFRWAEVFVNEDGGDVGLSDRRGVYAVIEKVSRGSGRLEFEKLSADGTTGGWLTNINRMDAVPEDGFPAANGATTPQLFRTAGPNRVQQTTANNPAVVGDDLPQQSNGFLNFDNPGGYAINPAQRAAIEGWYRQMEDVLYNNTTWRDPVNGYRRWIDDRDFAEYFVFNELSKNGDGMLISMFPWKGDDGKLRMGPVWDYNWSSYYIGGAANTGLRWRSTQIWYTRLFTDTDFLQLYIDRWFAFRRGAMSNIAMSALVDAQAAEITPAQAVMQGIPSAADWTNRLTQMKSWLSLRGDWVDGNYTRPPVLTPAGGIVASGATVALTAPSGTVYRTTDASDPRLSGGNVSAVAVAATTATISGDVKLIARARAGTSATWSAPTTGVYVIDAVPASAANLAVSEIHYRPADVNAAEISAGFTDRDDFEFVELMNTGAQKISLAGLRFVQGGDGAGIGYAFNDGTVWSLMSAQRLVIVKSRAAFALRYGGSIVPAGEYTGRLNNGGDSLRLVDAADATLRVITWDDDAPWPAGADGAGYSLTLTAPAANPDPADPANWRTSVAQGGTPGSDDSIPPTAGDPAGYVFAGPPAASIAGLAWVLTQPLVPGADAFQLVLSTSPDLNQWTPAPSSTYLGENRGPGGAVTRQWSMSLTGSRRFARVEAVARP